MKLTETEITTAGVMRCCLSCVAMEYAKKTVQLGDKSKCKYCGEEFVLTTNNGPRPKWITPEKWSVPVWKPTWQIN